MSSIEDDAAIDSEDGRRLWAVGNEYSEPDSGVSGEIG